MMIIMKMFNKFNKLRKAKEKQKVKVKINKK